SQGGLVLPGDIDVASIRVQGEPLAPSRRPAEPARWRRLTVVGLPPEGAVFAFESTPGRAVELHGYDSSPGIPAVLAGNVRSRDAVAVPIHGGDTTVAFHRFEVAGTPAP